MDSLKTQIMEADRMGAHYFRDHVTIDGTAIHWTPEGVAFYRQHYTTMLLGYEPNQWEHAFITEILQRLELHQHLYNQIFNY